MKVVILVKTVNVSRRAKGLEEEDVEERVEKVKENHVENQRKENHVEEVFFCVEEGRVFR